MGDKNTASLYYALLKEEFKISGKSDSLKPSQLKELKNIKESLSSGSIATTSWLAEPVVSTEEQDKSIGLEKEVVRKIYYEGFEKLKEILNANENFYLYNLEHPCADYGKADMVYMDDRIVYIVEVKKGIGKHDLLGQVMKYTLAMKMKLHYKLYDEVRAITICSGYKDYAVKELKKHGIITLVYEFIEDKFTLKLV